METKSTKERSPFLALEEARQIIKDATSHAPTIQIDGDSLQMKIASIPILGSLNYAEELVEKAKGIKDIIDNIGKNVTPLERKILGYLFDNVIYIARDCFDDITDFYAVGDSTERTSLGVSEELGSSKEDVMFALGHLLQNELISVQYTDSPYAVDDTVGVDTTLLWAIVERRLIFAKM